MMPPSVRPTEQEIWEIARRTTDIIGSKITTNVCLVGSAASSLWANIGRVPDDIDIIVSEDLDGNREESGPEQIKETIVGADDRYFLQPYRLRGATHHILYCRLPGWKTDVGRRIKVDILVPPTLGFPTIKESEAVLINDIPVVPIFDLLVTKTQGWWDHRTSLRVDSEAKESTDVSDIFALLERAIEEKVSYVDEAYKPRHSLEFMDYARTLASRFVQVHGKHERWRVLQFPV